MATLGRPDLTELALSPIIPPMRTTAEYTLPDMLYAPLFYRSHGVCYSNQLKSPRKYNPGAKISCIRQETV